MRGERTAVVRPASLPARYVRGVLCIQLDDLWEASRLAEAPGALVFDFVGGDGYRPSRNGFAPLPAAMLERGYLELETGDIAWEASAELACGYRVKGVTTIVALDADTRVPLRGDKTSLEL